MGDCKGCGGNETKEPVPYIVHEAAMARAERHTKRMFIALLVAIAFLFVSNAGWLWYMSQYDYTGEEISYDYSQDGAGLNIIGDRNGVDYYGAEVDGTP